jgi:hypothetical protein
MLMPDILIIATIQHQLITSILLIMIDMSEIKSKIVKVSPLGENGVILDHGLLYLEDGSCRPCIFFTLAIEKAQQNIG